MLYYCDLMISYFPRMALISVLTLWHCQTVTIGVSHK